MTFFSPVRRWAGARTGPTCTTKPPGGWGASPGEIAVYEDALGAAKTAKMAGYYVVAVYDGGTQPWEELKKLAG